MKTGGFPLSLLAKMSIRTKILVAFTVLVLIPAVTISGKSIYFGIRNGKKQVFEQLESVAALKGSEIRNWLQNLQTDLLSLEEEGFYKDIVRLASHPPGTDEFSRLHSSLVERLDQVIDLTKRFDEFLFLSSEGMVLLATDPLKEGEYRGLQPYFKEGMKKSGVHVQTRSFSPASEGLNRIFAVYPVQDGKGKTMGVICGQANLGMVNSIMGKRTGLGETGETYLVASNFVLMTVSRFPDYTPGMTAVFTPGVKRVFDFKQDGRGLYHDYRNVKIIGVYHYISNLNVALMSEMDQSEAFMGLYKSQMVGGIIALAAVLMTIGASLIIARNISSPLVSLSRKAAAIAQGDLEVRAPTDREDEIGTLARAFNNMTSRLKTTMEGLKESEEKYRSIFENAVEGLFQFKEDGSIVSANPAFARIFGYGSPEEMMHFVLDFKHQHVVDRTDQERFFDLMREQGSVTEFEARYMRRNGEIIWGAVHARPIYDSQGNVIYFEGIFQDITSRRKAAEEKEKLEEQLRQSQKMQAVGTLAGGVAHEFNNLLQAMSGQIQLLLMQKDSKDKDYKYLTNIERASERASDLVKRLLTFSRITEVEARAVDLNQVITNTIGLLEKTIPKMVSIETHLAKDLKLIEADPVQMEQILMNLSSNAADSMPNGGRLIVETSNVVLDKDFADRYLNVDPGRYIELQVSDTGTGMDEETVQHIFDPFFTTKEIGKGTGLGLSIVYGIVSAHNGFINCYSEPGVGTTFRVYIPQAGEHIEEKGAYEEDALEIQGGPETILIVDDEELILDVAEDILIQYGYSTIRAKSGEEALDKYKERKDDIDLVILDLGMPGMGGERCLRELQEIDPRVRVVVATGYAAHEITRDPQKFGAAASLGKPYRLNVLASTVRTVLNAHSFGKEEEE